MCFIFKIGICYFNSYITRTIGKQDVRSGLLIIYCIRHIFIYWTVLHYIHYRLCFNTNKYKIFLIFHSKHKAYSISCFFFSCFDDVFVQYEVCFWQIKNLNQTFPKRLLAVVGSRITLVWYQWIRHRSLDCLMYLTVVRYIYKCENEFDNLTIYVEECNL